MVELGVPIYDRPVCTDHAHTQKLPSWPSSEVLPMTIYTLLDNGSSDIWSAEIFWSFNIGLGGSTVLNSNYSGSYDLKRLKFSRKDTKCFDIWKLSFQYRYYWRRLPRRYRSSQWRVAVFYLAMTCRCSCFAMISQCLEVTDYIFSVLRTVGLS